MRKCRAAAGDSSKAPAVPLLGVRTRSRVAAVVGGAAGVAKRRKQATTTTAARAAKELALSGGSDAGCYLHLRSRKLFMASAAVAPPRGLPRAEEEVSSAAATLADSGASREAAVAGISRYSSTASSAARERNSGGEAEVCESRDAVESSVSDSGCGNRERREATPSSQSPANSSDLESGHAGGEQKHQRTRSPAIRPTTGAARTFQFEERAAKMPPVAEIEEFFAAAEKAEAERFAAKYNFDVALGVPLTAGRFEWTPVASV